MFNFDYITKEGIKEHNPNWPETPDDPYRILTVRGSGSGKTNALLNLINHKTDIDKIYSYAKDLNRAKYKFLINKRESTGLNYLNDLKAFIEHSNDTVGLIFIKVLKNIIQMKNKKYELCLTI